MGQFLARRANGTPIIFRIKGEAPSQTEMARINAHLTAKPQAAVTTEPPKEEAPGMLTQFGRGVARGWNEIQAGVDTAGQSLFEALGDPARAKEWEQAAQAQRAERDTYGTPEGSFLDSNTNKANAIAGTIGQSAPSMGLGLGGMGVGTAVGAAIGAPFGGPIGAGIGGAIGGVIGGALGYGPQMLNANAERQIEEHGYVKDWGKAYASTALQSGVETITDKIGLRVLGVIGAAGKATVPKATQKVIKDAVAKATQKSMTLVAKRIGEGAALSAVTGASEEVIQQGLERWQAELPMMDDKAKAEYIESAIMGGIVESIFGAGAGAHGGMKEAKNQEALRQAKEDIDAEAADLSARQKAFGPKQEGQPPQVEDALAKPLDNQVVAGAQPDNASDIVESFTEDDEQKLPAGLKDTETEGPKPPPPAPPAPVPSAPLSPHAVPDLVGKEGMRLIHGTGDAQLTQDRINLIHDRPGKKGRLYAGFFGHAEEDLSQAENFSRRMGGTPTVYNVDIAPGTKIFRQKGTIIGLTQERMNELANQGYGVVAGTGPKGRTEYAVINKSAVTGMSPRVAAAGSETTQEGSAPQASRVTATPKIGEEVSPISETDYKKSVVALRDKGTLSIDRIRKTLGVSKPMAEAYFNEILKRGDAHAAGNKDQYIKIIEPHGTGETVDKTGKGRKRRTREYVVRAVQSADAKPFSVEMDGKKVGRKVNFATREEALDWIDKNIPANRQKEATVSEDPKGIQYGIHELQHEHIPGKDQRTVSDTLLKTFVTENEATEALKGFDAAYSPESNQHKEQQTAEEKQAAIEEDFTKQVGPVADSLKAYGEKVLGKGRVDVGILPRLTNPEAPDGIVEGTSQDIKRTDPDGMKRVIGNLIRIANDLYNPNLTTEQRAQLMEQVFNHELIHALRSLDLLTPQEWDTLFQHAVNAKVPGKKYTWLQRAAIRAEGSSSNILAEEAIAEMARHYMNDPTAFRNPERSLLRKIADFIKKMMRLSQRHDAADLMDTIFSGGIADREIGHGGLGPRGPDDITYSLLKTDNFYLDTMRFLEKVTRETAPKNDWIKMLSSAGIKPDELNWLGIKQWLQDLPKGEEVHRNDIMNFVKASGPNVRAVVFANPAHPDLGQAAISSPQWVERSQTSKADKTYAEVALTFPGKEGEPDYFDKNGHMTVPAGKGRRKLENVLAFVRFRDVERDGKRIMFLEEMQSDLHQRGSKVGYYSKSAVAKYEQLGNEARALYDKQRQLEGRKVVIADQIWMLQQMEKRIRAETGGAVNERLLTNRRQVQERLQEMVDLGPQIDAVRKEHSDVVQEMAAARERLAIPNAPFKSNWEDYVIRRMIRHAVEHGYDGISWHGSPESVAVTEGYGELETTQDEKGRNQYTAYGDVSVSPIVNRYLLKLPRITRGIADPFGAVLEHSVVQSRDRPPTWEPEPWELGIDEGPSLSAAEALPEREDMFDFINALHKNHQDNIHDDVYQHDSEKQDAETLIDKLKTAMHVTRNRRNYDPDDILKSAGLERDEINHVLSWHAHGDYYRGLDAAMGMDEQKGGVPLDTYDLMFTQPMMDSFEKGDQPFFSMVRQAQAQANPQYSAAAPTGTRVPPVPPIDRLSEVHNRITYDNLSPVLHKLIDWTIPGGRQKALLKEKADDTIISLQDRMLSIGRLIDRMKKNGGFITNENDVYLREQLYSSQTDAHLTANDKDFYKPMMDTIQGLSVTRRDYDEARTISPRVAGFLDGYKVNHKHALAELYLYAQHALERNALMKKRNERIAGERPMQYEAGSGMGDGEAQAVLDWFATKPFAREFMEPTNPNSVRSRMRAIVRSTNDIRVASGLTPDFRTLLHPDGTPVDTYQDYVPIRGFLGEASLRDEDMSDFAKTGKGFNIRGKEDYSALGRESMGRDLIAHAIMQNQETIVRAGKNKVAQSFRKLILDNPAQMAGVAEILQMPRTKYRYDVKTGTVVQSVDNQVMTDPTVLKGKVDGQQFYIKMKDDKIVRAMGSKSGLGSNTGMHSLIKGLAAVNRFLAATRTSYNPEFMIANMLRDLEAAMVNLSEQKRKGVRRKVIASVLPALNGVRQSLRSGNPTGEWAKVHEEFRRHGGHTAVFGIRELADTIDHINQHLAEDVSGAKHKVLKPLKALGKFISDYNLAIENGTRLAAYKVLRDQYLELSGDPHDAQNQLRAKEMAAFAAKNLTVNFNMGGEMKPMMTAFYMFFNASMQGSMALLNPFIRSRRMKYVWASVLAAGAVQDMLMSALSPEDDDGEKTYDKIPPHVLEHNMVFMDPFGISERGYFKIPMPYLMNGIYNWGRASSRAARGKYTMGELMSTGGMTMIDSLNPMGGSNSFLNWVVPSIIDPVVDLYMNEDFTGKPIAPPVSPYDNVGENRSQQYWNNTHPLFVSIADWMSQLTGRQGDYIPGKMEYSPNQVEYAVDWITGGTGTFLARAGRLMYGGATGELPEMEIEATDIPFLRKAYGTITTRNDLQDYIEGRDQVLRVHKAMKDARRDNDDAMYLSIIQKYPKEYKIAARINAFENARKKISTKIKKIRESKKGTEESREARIKMLKDRQDNLVGRANEVMAAID
jgi:hypothetical protein